MVLGSGNMLLFFGVQYSIGSIPLCSASHIAKMSAALSRNQGKPHFFFHTCRIGCHINGISIYLMVAYFLKKKGWLHFFRQIDLFHGGYKPTFR